MAGSLQEQMTTALNVLGRLRPLAIVLVGTAVVSTMFAGVAVRDAVTAFSKAKAVSDEQASQVKLARQDLLDEDYTRIGGVVAGLYPGIMVEVPAVSTKTSRKLFHDSRRCIRAMIRAKPAPMPAASVAVKMAP